MKRKLWILLSLVLVFSIVYTSSALASNPVVDTFLGGRVVLNSSLDLYNGYGYITYDNAGHSGTAYTNYIKMTYIVKSTQLYNTYTTYYKSASVLNGRASVSYSAPTFTESYSVQNHGNVNELGEIWVGDTDIIKY